MEKNNGGPAFPGFDPKEFEDTADWARPKSMSYGMSFRDWLAGMALQGLLAADGFKYDSAEKAYELADAMLKARETQE